MLQRTCLREKTATVWSWSDVCFLHTISVPPLVDTPTLFFSSFHISLSCALKKKKRKCLSNLKYNTRRMFHSTELKVFFTIIPVLRDDKKQCQDQIVNKTWSHPLCSFFLCFWFMDGYLKTCMILLLWDTNIFSLGICSPLFPIGLNNIFPKIYIKVKHCVRLYSRRRGIYWKELYQYNVMMMMKMMAMMMQNVVMLGQRTRRL